MSEQVLFVVNQTVERQHELKKTYQQVHFEFYSSIKEVTSFADTTVLVTFGEDVTPTILEQAKDLKWIHVLSAGVEHLPFEQILNRDILVTNSRGIHATPMSEHAMWMMLDYVKRAQDYRQAQAERAWVRSQKPSELTDLTVVLLGTGAIASKISERAAVFGMKTIGVNTDGRPVHPFDDVVSMREWELALKQADFLINVLPATEQTKKILNEDAFRLVKQGAVFINLGRGNAVVEHELIRVLDNKHIDHAYLDVFNEEPLSSDSPLWGHHSVTITPHISASTSFYMERALKIFNENLSLFIEGKENFINEVHSKKGY
ncbi:D-2-hydroxyacid dehydrogenase [Shouchella hunanensis]|uniref:D-2-hydroxyacid dehydrogenase n=1 Tax=Shouchella hunanensis TaxID=766894 RepID=A0ABY7W3T7_9BACI|nr:D-2-hydroxyacid dehydrogenase [Shouchella hunanensis]WDF02731.1 D-2-hydroxyacid dehydrogenase [Shouchella hunanensis]GAF22549.1 phosphoglycerate dehydrogenase [Bacillus sp. JCM 19047]